MMHYLQLLALFVISTIVIWVTFQKFRTMYFGKKCKSWPCVTGRIIQSAYYKNPFNLSNGKVIQNKLFKMDVWYVYKINGKEYKSNRLSFNISSIPSEKIAAHLCSRFPEGQEVSVYYNPKNPKISTLSIT